MVHRPRYPQAQREPAALSAICKAAETRAAEVAGEDPPAMPSAHRVLIHICGTSSARAKVSPSLEHFNYGALPPRPAPPRAFRSCTSSRSRPLHSAALLSGEHRPRSRALAVAPLGRMHCLAIVKEPPLAIDEVKEEPRIILQRQRELHRQSPSFS